MTAPRPARGLRVGWLAAITVAAVTAIGLGMIALPSLKASGLLDRAIQAAHRARTAHVTTRVWGVGGEVLAEDWLSQDGFRRMERWEGDELVNLDIFSGSHHLSYRWLRATRARHAEETFEPIPWVRASPEGQLQGVLLPLDAPLHKGSLTLLDEREEADASGAVKKIVEMSWRPGERNCLYMTVYDQAACDRRGLVYEEDDEIFIRMQIDPDTDLPVQMEHYRLTGRTWELTCLSQYEWDMEIPQEVREFEPPRGTTLERDLWWETRIDAELARASSRDWVVTIHALDVNRSGDIVLSVSRAETGANKTTNSAPPIVVQAVGDDGSRYSQSNVGPFMGGPGVAFAATPLQAEDAGARPKSVTLTIWPYPSSPSEDQSVTFRNIPLPPRRDVDDVQAAEREVIQY